MQKNEELIGILNDLIRINNDRFEGYKKALKQTREIDQDLRTLFYKMADESRKNTSAFITQILKLRTVNTTGAGLTGSVYREWLESKQEFAATDRLGIINYCEHMEKMVQKAYDSALSIEAEIPENIAAVIKVQRREMTGSHHVVKSYQTTYESIAA